MNKKIREECYELINRTPKIVQNKDELRNQYKYPDETWDESRKRIEERQI